MIKKLSIIIITATISIVATLPVASYAQSESVRHFNLSDKGATVNVTVNDTAYDFLVDPSLRNIIMLSPNLVAANNVKESGVASLFPFSADVDGRKLKGRTGKLRLDISDVGLIKTRAYWFEENTWAGTDGVLGASGFDEDELVFVSDKHQGKSTLIARTFDLTSKKDWSVRTELNGLPVFVKFRPHYAHSRANMISTVALKDRGLVKPTGTPVAIQREFAQKAYAQNAIPLETLSILGAKYSEIVIQDTEANITPSVTDVDEVIAQASKKKKSKGPAPEFFLGQDYFEQCPKVVFNKKAKQVTTHCLR